MNSYIYIIGADAPPYKIGISKEPQRRLRSLQTGHPYPLKIHNLKETDLTETKYLERMIHQNLKHYRTKGEWFQIDLKDAVLEVEYAVMRYSKID